MDMQTKHPEQLLFHLTGQRQGDGLAAVAGLELRPALLGAYRDLTRLRHDFPLVLIDEPQAAEHEAVRSLTSLVDAALREVAPRGVEGERLRRHALQLEHEIRVAVEAGAQGTLAELWDAAAARLGAREGETLEQVLQHTGTALPGDGEVLGCTAAMPARLLTHAWRAATRAKALRFATDLSRLVVKLSDILRAAYSHSQAGRTPQALQRALGGPHHGAFDFDTLSRIIGKGVPRDELPPRRRERIERTLRALETQRFHALPSQLADGASVRPYDFAFASCAEAAQAFRRRLPELVELVKALSVAELEVNGHYVEAQHDLIFGAFGEHSLTPDDLARFPDYLVCIPPERNEAPENANLMEMLSSGLPVKVLVQTSDLLEQTSIGTGRFAFGVRSARLATTAMGLGGMFVLQSAASNLYALRQRIAQGASCRGPALFSVYAAAPEVAGALPPYLSAAAAMQSRAFAAFSYDAAAGSNWATRFSLENNPQPEVDWSVETLDYVDTALQRASVRCAFTFADFALCDPRRAAHFALVPRDHWTETMLPVADWLELDEPEAARRAPYLLAVDRSDALQRVIVDTQLMQATRRCQLLWRRLQEHGGINDSHAQRLLERERAAWAAARAAATQAAAATADAAAVESPASQVSEPELPPHSRDEAWIDTPRCPSCNECQLINAQMFAYDDRKQAYIRDITAGTYRQLVEAAESCQVAIIHPGKPRDPNEPGLEELLARAEPFR
jgi:ferredoxin